ncbi:unnamed protein product [Strongylus vulgaris]|uniref:Uncharacterized protein n=1 Tax=Strongylus vulgaris TaxID=40348 RepID=A0A3P7JFC6_STRVU|nr:unnamed protein product [Strongylus vulgaris]
MMEYGLMTLCLFTLTTGNLPLNMRMISRSK